MDFVGRLAKVLVDAESELQKVSSEAVAAGDYGAVRTGLAMAEAIAELRLRSSLEEVDGDADAGGLTPRTAKGSVPDRAGRLKNRDFPSRQSGKYPRFIRRGDKLIKVGWSKRSRSEYEHKAPHAVLKAFAAHLRKKTRGGRVFTVDDLTPILDPGGDGELPAYQVYLVLAWFRAAGIATKHGRDGYSFKPAGLTEKALSQAWDQLPSSN